MPKQGEIDYLKNIGEAGIYHALHKPFTDGACGQYLMEIGAVMNLLPAPPARLLDLGCGTGWTSCFFAKRGYTVVGQDIAPDMIQYADMNRQTIGLDNIAFVTCDYESMAFQDEFDCAVFFDALHHAIDEVEALRSVYRALKPGGICITSEPGAGHSKSLESIQAMAQFGVTERDMPPGTIIRAAKQVGFRASRVYPHASDFGRLYAPPKHARLRKLWRWPIVGGFVAWYIAAIRKRSTGIVVLIK